MLAYLEEEYELEPNEVVWETSDPHWFYNLDEGLANGHDQILRVTETGRMIPVPAAAFNDNRPLRPQLRRFLRERGVTAIPRWTWKR
jgi:hypothetical protein